MGSFDGQPVKALAGQDRFERQRKASPPQTHRTGHGRGIGVGHPDPCTTVAEQASSTASVPEIRSWLPAKFRIPGRW
ncbi:MULTISPECIES: hypothetical protein [unclassified Meiothermus]|uniref:hypothetical protein n=1 Tax=unclassified Meiothermus TaxID=370471 RepID=UPI0010214335|nr:MULTISPECIES: hypothetical protein [unclassified Meiothermus]RYM31519.1 hypothetical protein EWH23_14625 [Meiothermus sp. PNK-Is4]